LHARGQLEVVVELPGIEQFGQILRTAGREAKIQVAIGIAIDQ
jgi:hypothetical protein